MTFSEAIESLNSKPREQKVIFIKSLLFDLTVMNRAILDDDTTSQEVKIDCLKWSNEISHRIWHILMELENGTDNDAIYKLADHLKFYQKQSNELSGHLAGSFKTTISKFFRM